MLTTILQYESLEKIKNERGELESYLNNGSQRKLGEIQDKLPFHVEAPIISGVRVMMIPTKSPKDQAFE